MDGWDRTDQHDQDGQPPAPAGRPAGVFGALARVLVLWRDCHDTAWDAAFELSHNQGAPDARGDPSAKTNR